MPHYKDGTEAKVGDQVAGKLYNTPGVRAGTIISITPGVDSCNAMVGFLVAVKELPSIGKFDTGSPLRMAILDKASPPPAPGDVAVRHRVVKGEAHGSSGPEYALVECADYCAVNELTKLSE